MPQALRPNRKAMQIAYKILKVPKDQQQQNQKKPSPEKIREWFRDSSQSQQNYGGSVAREGLSPSFKREVYEKEKRVYKIQSR